MRGSKQVAFFISGACDAKPPPQQPHLARSLVDNFLIEFIATLFIYVAIVLFGTADGDMRFAPSLSLGLVILCLKDEDLFFPDASATVSVVLYYLGAYNVPELMTRLCGQACALAVAVAIFIDTHHAEIPHGAPLKMVFFYEGIGTIMEHLTIVYFVVPMLMNAATANASIARKSELTGPPSGAVAHAAFAVTLLHFLFQRGVHAEMNPTATCLLATLSIVPIDHAITALAGQCIGVIFSLVYLSAFAPRVRTR
jgi:glycerol uptake facilitator-like aquaporin